MSGTVVVIPVTTHKSSVVILQVFIFNIFFSLHETHPCNKHIRASCNYLIKKFQSSTRLIIKTAAQ